MQDGILPTPIAGYYSPLQANEDISLNRGTLDQCLAPSSREISIPSQNLGQASFGVEAPSCQKSPTGGIPSEPSNSRNVQTLLSLADFPPLAASTTSSAALIAVSGDQLPSATPSLAFPLPLGTSL